MVSNRIVCKITVSSFEYEKQETGQVIEVLRKIQIQTNKVNIIKIVCQPEDIFIGAHVVGAIGLIISVIGLIGAAKEH